MEIIPAEVLIANMCAAGYLEISMRELNEMRRKIEKIIPNCYIYFDVDKYAIQYAMSAYSDYFDWKESSNTITCKVKLNFLWTNKHMNWRIPEKYRKQLINIIRGKNE